MGIIWPLEELEKLKLTERVWHTPERLFLQDAMFIVFSTSSCLLSEPFPLKYLDSEKGEESEKSYK